MLEIGKLYVVKKKPHRWTTGCSQALCLNGMDCWHSSTYICDDSQIVWIKPASRNDVSIWNRMFDDNVKMDCYD